VPEQAYDGTTLLTEFKASLRRIEDLHVESVLEKINDDTKLVRGGAGFVTRRRASFKEWKPKFKSRKVTKVSMLEKGAN
jgi:hypothetical protein